MIRHYEKIGLIPAPPPGTVIATMASDLHRLRFIANARDLGFPIEEIRTCSACGPTRAAAAPM
jgi:DNA-binding transcriptional MerR regulator